jgi:hypothetical protein
MGRDDDMNNLFETVCFPKKYAKIEIYILSLLEDKQQFKFWVVMTGHLTLFLAYFLVAFI